MPAEAVDSQALKNLAQLKEILSSDISKAEKLVNRTNQNVQLATETR